MKRLVSTFTVLVSVSFLTAGCGELLEDGELTIEEKNRAEFRLAPQCLTPEGKYRDDCGTDWCGDNICAGYETIANCPTDCGWCGDNVCSYNESTRTCPRDCPAVCGDGVCEGGETLATCNADCGPRLRSLDVYKVRRCRNSGILPCNSMRSSDEFRFWDNAGVTKDRQKNTYVAAASDPPKHKVKHLVFLTAGQSMGTGLPARFTGQPSGYRNAYNRRTDFRRFQLSSSAHARDSRKRQRHLSIKRSKRHIHRRCFRCKV